MNGGLRGLDVKGLGSLPIPEGLGLGSCDCRAPRSTATRVHWYIADSTVQGTWVEHSRAERLW